MQDETTIQHAESSRPEPDASGATPGLAALAGRPREPYVPASVRCAECGCPGSAFEWPQRVRAGAVDGATPDRALHFCGIVCLGAYAADRFGSWSPTTDPVRRPSTPPDR